MAELTEEQFEVRKMNCYHPWRIFHIPTGKEIAIPRSLTNGDGGVVSYTGPACFPRKRDALAWMRDDLPALLRQYNEGCDVDAEIAKEAEP